jgi:hypothetical protein
MSDKDLLDHTFDFLEKVTKWLYDKDLIKNWFNFIGWTFMTAVAFGLAKSGDSRVIFGVGFVSAILVFFYGWHSTHEIIKTFLEEKDKLSKKAVWASLLIATFVPAVLMFYILSAVSSYVLKNS